MEIFVFAFSLNCGKCACIERLVFVQELVSVFLSRVVSDLEAEHAKAWQPPLSNVCLSLARLCLCNEMHRSPCWCLGVSKKRIEWIFKHSYSLYRYIRMVRSTAYRNNEGSAGEMLRSPHIDFSPRVYKVFVDQLTLLLLTRFTHFFNFSLRSTRCTCLGWFIIVEKK